MSLPNFQQVVVDIIASYLVYPLPNGCGTRKVERCTSYWLQSANANKILVQWSVRGTIDLKNMVMDRTLEGEGRGQGERKKKEVERNKMDTE